MKFLVLSSRNSKEILRDPINLFFGVGFPIILLLLLSAIQLNVPTNLFHINNLSPGIAIFGLSFFSLFSGTLIAKDRASSFMMRLFASPLTSTDFIVGYTFPFVPIAFIQVLITFTSSVFFGFRFNLNTLFALFTIIPTIFLYIGIGLLAGSIFNDKQVGAVCGALLTNISAWLSGVWFDIKLLGKTFENIANFLPFVHAVEASRAAVHGNYSSAFSNLWWVTVYTLVIFIVAILVFKEKMKNI